MLQGTIDTVGQMHVPIELITADGGQSTFVALLDTGFTGSIGIRGALLPALVELGGSIHTIGDMVSYGSKVAKLL